MSNVIEEELLSKWEILNFAQKHDIYKIRLWNGQTFQFGKSDMKTSCEKYPDLSLSPSCIEVSYCALRFFRLRCHSGSSAASQSSHCCFVVLSAF